MDGIIIAVSRSADYTFSKPNETSIRLLAGLGVEGDIHSGEKVKHRIRILRTPNQPNLRQVHLIHAELHDELRTQGFDVSPGQMGRTSPPAILTCSACQRGHACIWEKKPWSK